MAGFHAALGGIAVLIEAGGPVLYAIAALSFVMWTLVFERLCYFRFTLPADAARIVAAWERRAERQSWQAHQIRRAMLSRLRLGIERNVALIRACVAICPLLGLLGTVTGMIVVFELLATGAGGDVRAMTEGVSRATIPTMAGMVAAIPGVFAHIRVVRIAKRQLQLVSDRLTMDH